MENAEDVRAAVELYIYDLSKGMAATMSTLVIGRHIEGIWHTAIVVYGREYYFGPVGIQSSKPGGTVLGQPNKVERIGDTYLPYSIFLEYIEGLRTSKFAPGTYNLLKHNCNCFTEEVSHFLAGKGIPKYILDLPEEIVQTPIGKCVGTLIESLSSNVNETVLYTVGQVFLDASNRREVSPEYELLNEAIEEARLNSIALEERRNELNEKLAKKDRKKKKKKKKEKKHKGSRDSTANDTSSTGPSNCAYMAESEKYERSNVFILSVYSHDVENYDQTWVDLAGIDPLIFEIQYLVPFDFYIWGTSKRKVYDTEVTLREEIMQRINNSLAEIQQRSQEIRSAIKFTPYRRQVCVDVPGRHFEMRNGADDMQATIGDSTDMLPSDRFMQMEEEEQMELEERKRHRDPPIVFKDLVDVKSEYQALSNLLEGKLNEEEGVCMQELEQYIIENEGSWALGDNFLNFVGRILYDKSLSSDTRVKLLNILSVAALKDDVILLLHQDRREHIIMNYAFDIDRHPQEEQFPLTQFIANMFENLSSSEWLLYISEWQHQNQNTSNIRVTTKVAVHSLLSNSVDMQIRGAAIIHNLACKEVFDDVAVELTMALLQYFNGNPAEEQLFACMKSLARFTQISGQDVPQLIQMIGPEPNKFRGISERVDEQIDEVNKKLR